MMLIPAALAAAVLSCAFIEATDVLPQPPEGGANPNETALLVAAKQANYRLHLTFVGGAVAGLLGLGAGIAQRSPARAGLCLLLGAGLGAGLGLLAGLAAVEVETRLLTAKSGEPTRAMLVHAAVWLLVGLAVGTACGVATKSWRGVFNSIGAACLAGILSALLFYVVASIAFPLERSDLPTPTGMGNRLLWVGLAAVLMAIALARTVADGRSRYSAT
ncbi:MAG: hypothetical protein KY475_02800 [Planctomycetes bacterium]|nr:hypothetical protein [Planctomycetota bacterium]